MFRGAARWRTGAEVLRSEVQRCKGAGVQRGRSAEGQECRSAGVLRGRGAEVQKC